MGFSLLRETDKTRQDKTRQGKTETDRMKNAKYGNKTGDMFAGKGPLKECFKADGTRRH